MPDGHQPCHNQLTKYTTLVDIQMRYVKLQSLINSHIGPECRESAQDQSCLKASTQDHLASKEAKATEELLIQSKGI